MIWQQVIIFFAYLFVYIIGYQSPLEGVKLLSALFMVVLAATYNSEMQTMQWHPKNKPLWYKHPWWCHREDFQNRTWLLNYPLSMFWDGWHYCEFICIISLLSLAGIWSGYFFLPLIGYIVWGISWNYFFDN